MMLNSVRRAGSTLGLLVVFVFLLEESVCIAGQEVQGYYNQDSDPYVPTVKTATTCATEYEVQVTACNTQVQAGASMCAVDQANLYSESTFATLSCCNTTVASTSQCPTDTSSYGNKQLSEMILEKEAYIKDLATNARSSLDGRCFSLATCDIQCSYKSCSTNIGPSTQCTKRFGGLSNCPGATNCNSRKLNLDKSSIILASELGSQNLRDEFVCGTRTLDTFFKTKYTNDLLWTYFGDIYGQFRIFPGYARERDGSSCKAYDPRIRPWYLAASSGPKDVVIVLDISGSMNVYAQSSKSRIQIIKETLNGHDGKAGLLDTFSFVDYISIVLFNGEANVLSISDEYSSDLYLVQATTQNIAKAKTAVNGIAANGQTNFRAGFKKAFEVLQTSAKTEGHTSSCSSVILFLTDGKDGDCETCDSYRDSYGACKCTENMLSQIDEMQSQLETAGGKRATVFTYSMGTGADDAIPRSIACKNGGAWGSIADGEDPISKMTGYYKFMARSNINANGVFWTEPYPDDPTGEMVTTAAKAVYESQGGQHLLGVVGVDVPLKALDQSYSTSYQSLLSNLNGRSRACYYTSPNTCEMQMLREESPCALSLPTDKCCFKPKAAGTGFKSYVLVNYAKPFEEAKRYCQEAFNGGLGVPANQVEYEFMSGIVPSDGAWVGLQNTGGVTDDGWSWLPHALTNAKSQYPLAKIWGSGRGSNKCGAMDSRGSNNNVIDENCNKRFPFVCEFFDEGKVNEYCADCAAYGTKYVATTTESSSKKSEEKSVMVMIIAIIIPVAGALLGGGLYYKSKHSNQFQMVCCSSGNFGGPTSVIDGNSDSSESNLPDKVTKPNVTNVTYNITNNNDSPRVVQPGGPPAPHYGGGYAPSAPPQYGVQMTGYPPNQASAYPTLN